MIRTIPAQIHMQYRQLSCILFCYDSIQERITLFHYKNVMQGMVLDESMQHFSECPRAPAQ